MQFDTAEPWLVMLRSEQTDVRDRAIAELRVLLLRGMSKSLTNRYGQPFSAEDIVQDALLKILNSLDSFRGQSKFTTWAMTVATRVGISSLRRKYHQDVSMDAFISDDGYRFDVAVSPNRNYEDDEDRQHMLVKLQELIDNQLTAKQRQALRAFLAGFSSDGIAERMGMNRNAVYKLIHDARMKLRAGFEQAGITADDVQATFAGGKS